MPKIAVKTKTRSEQDNEFLTAAPEVSIFLACLGMIDELRLLERSFKASAMSDQTFFEQFNEILSQLTRAAEATERFDVLWPVMDYGKFSPFFWRWFNWWDDYFQRTGTLSPGQTAKLNKEVDLGTTSHRPQGDWIGYRETPALRIFLN